MSDYADIQLEIEDPVALIRLDRPRALNAFTYPMLAEIRDAVERAVADRRVVGIVFTGTGRGFSAGLDSSALAAATRESDPAAVQDAPTDDSLPGLFSYLLEVPKPVIAAVNGVAAGGGFILALASDIRIASTDASFTTVFLKRGLIAEHGASWLLPRLVGLGRALDLLWTSDRIDAERAHAIGLVEHLAEPDALLDTARAYVRKLAENASPAAMAETKRLVYRHYGRDAEAAIREAISIQGGYVVADDAREGATALMEKRAPHFRRLGE